MSAASSRVGATMRACSNSSRPCGPDACAAGRRPGPRTRSSRPHWITASASTTWAVHARTSSSGRSGSRATVAPPPPDEPADDFQVVDVPETRRYEARLRGEKIGFSRYAIRDGTIAILHTEVDPSVEGKGYGSRLARSVLDDATSRGLAVHVMCPFIAAYVRRHAADYPSVQLLDKTA